MRPRQANTCLDGILFVLLLCPSAAFVPFASSPARFRSGLITAGGQRSLATCRLQFREHQYSSPSRHSPHHLVDLRALATGMEEQSFLLPLGYSLCAGLSTGLGGLSVFFLRNSSPETEAGVSAMMLGTAAGAMVTVSFVDLFLDISHSIGFEPTLACSAVGAAMVLLFSLLDLTGGLESPHTDETSDSRLGRLGVLTAITLTAHNFPEGMAVAISTMESAKLGLKLAVAIALHNVPEGLAIACPMIASKRFSATESVGVTLASGLSEPVAALLTLIFFKNFITQGDIDYALAFVGGVMMAVAVGGLLPEALKLNRPAMTSAGLATGAVVMGLSLHFLN